MEEKIVFDTLNRIDVSGKIKEKGGLKYLSWASAWTEVKKEFPDATYRIIPQVVDDGGNTRFWHDDGKSGWVSVAVTIGGIELTEVLAIMDFKNKAIPADQITSVDANKSLKRCLVKACALHGLGMYIYEGEDVPEETSKVLELQDEIKELVAKKCAASEKAKEQVGSLCKAAEKEANPDTPDDAITGNYKNIEDVTVLENLKKRLMAIRK